MLFLVATLGYVAGQAHESTGGLGL
jgi:hypothetical protein